MDKTIQDLAWSILPKEFKEKVKEQFRDGFNDDRDVIGRLFGVDNLLSDAEGEELLTVSRKRVQEIYNHCNCGVAQVIEDIFGKLNYDMNNDGIITPLDKFKELPHLNEKQEVITDYEGYAPTLYPYEGKWFVSWVSSEGDSILDFQAESPEKAIELAYNHLFGSKCLPDGNEDNFASKEQEHDYTPNGCTHPNKENCRWKDKSLDCNLKNGCYYEPKPAEPKFKVGDTVSYILPMIKYKCTVIKVMQNEHSGKWEYNVMFKWGKSEMWIPESDLALYTEPKFKVGDKVTVIDYNKGLPNLSRCEHKIFTVATVKWENGGYMYTLKTNEKLFKKNDYLDHLDWCEDYLKPYAEPEINTFKDLRKSGKYNRYLLCNDRYQEIALEYMNPYERKMFATGIIAQLKEYYGGMVPFPQPTGCAKIVLCPYTKKFEVDIHRDWDALMTFHNIEQAERFLKYNEQLVRDYYMLPRKEELC